ncbi:MAG: DUF2878 domain-containing protein [Pseudoxanthomonas sp.]
MLRHRRARPTHATEAGATRWSRLLFNVVGNQAVWFVAVIAASSGHAWPGVLAAAVFVGAHVVAAQDPRGELKLVAAALVCGVVVDGIAASQGWLRYAAPLPGGEGWPPAWILALWALLAVTLNVAMRSLQRRLWLGMLLGGIGAPLAYLAAAKGWDAVRFADPAWKGIAWLAAAWAMALPALLWAAREWGAAASVPHRTGDASADTR